jgi:hypothetical protein
MRENEISNLNETIAQALQQMKAEQGDKFSLEKVNLAELSRRTGISRKRLRNAKKHGFRILAHGNSCRKKSKTVITDYTTIIDNKLGKGVTNSSVIFEHLQENGYKGGVHRSRSTSRITGILFRQNARRLLHRGAGESVTRLLQETRSRWTGVL